MQKGFAFEVMARKLTEKLQNYYIIKTNTIDLINPTNTLKQHTIEGFTTTKNCKIKLL